MEEGPAVPEEPVLITRVRRLRVADSVAAQLGDLIAQGEFKPGARLPAERALADQFGVGRSTMREALRLAEARRLLRVEHGVGVFVETADRPPDRYGLLVFDEFTLPDLFEVRLALEPLAAALAAQRMTPTYSDELTSILAKLADPDLSDDDFVKLDALLHRTIARASRNALLDRIQESIEPQFLVYSSRVIKIPNRRQIAQSGHAQIVNSVCGRKIGDARTAAATHIRDVERDVVRLLEEA